MRRAKPSHCSGTKAGVFPEQVGSALLGRHRKHLCSEKKRVQKNIASSTPSLLAHNFCCTELVSAVDQQFPILFVLFYHLYYRILNTKHLLGLGQSSCLWQMFPDSTWYFKNPKEKGLKGSFHPPHPF